MTTAVQKNTLPTGITIELLNSRKFATESIPALNGFNPAHIDKYKEQLRDDHAAHLQHVSEIAAMSLSVDDGINQLILELSDFTGREEKPDDALVLILDSKDEVSASVYGGKTPFGAYRTKHTAVQTTALETIRTLLAENADSNKSKKRGMQRKCVYAKNPEVARTGALFGMKFHIEDIRLIAQGSELNENAGTPQKPTNWRHLLMSSAYIAAGHKWIYYCELYNQKLKQLIQLANEGERVLYRLGSANNYLLASSDTGDATTWWDELEDLTSKWQQMDKQLERVGQLAVKAYTIRQTLQVEESANEWVNGLVSKMKTLRQLCGKTSLTSQVAEVLQMYITDPLLTKSTTQNMMLLGNPGAGMAAVCRAVARVYGACGMYLDAQSDDGFVESGRQDFVSTPGQTKIPIPGQTAQKTADFLYQNLEKVVFIDEAYSLVNGVHDEDGREAIQEMLRFMDQKKGCICIFMGGYAEKMKKQLIETNQGLIRRFHSMIVLSALTPERLFEICWDRISKSDSVSPLSLYTVDAYRVLFHFIRRARTKHAYPPSAYKLFKDQAADAELIADHAIRFAHMAEIKRPMDECAMGQVLYEWSKMRMQDNDDRDCVQVYLNAACRNNGTITKTYRLLSGPQGESNTLPFEDYMAASSIIQNMLRSMRLSHKTKPQDALHLTKSALAVLEANTFTSLLRKDI